MHSWRPLFFALQERLWNLRVEIACYRSNMDFSFGRDVVGQTVVRDVGRLARSFHHCLMTGRTGVCKWITSGSKTDLAAQPASTTGSTYPASPVALSIVAPAPGHLSSKGINYCFQKCTNLLWCGIILAIKHERSMMSD